MMKSKVVNRLLRRTDRGGEGRSAGTRILARKTGLFRFAVPAVLALGVLAGGLEAASATPAPLEAAAPVDAIARVSPVTRAIEPLPERRVGLDAAARATSRLDVVPFLTQGFAPASAMSAMAHVAASRVASFTPPSTRLGDHKILFGLVVLLFAGMMAVVTLMWRRLVATLKDSTRPRWED